MFPIASLISSRIKMRSLDILHLEKEMATHCSILAWKTPRTEELVGYSPWGRKESDITEHLHFHFNSDILLIWIIIPSGNMSAH